MLFCWQSQHKLLVGFMTTLEEGAAATGRKHTGRVDPVAAACLYNSHTLCLVVLLGRNWISDLLYPGTWPSARKDHRISLLYLQVWHVCMYTCFLTCVVQDVPSDVLNVVEEQEGMLAHTLAMVVKLAIRSLPSGLELW